jgi:tetratricopeptide (TPR) repeat protein
MKDLAISRPLQPFELEQVQALVRSLFGQTVSDLQLGAFLHRHGGGNPGLCMELARHLVHAGALRFADGEWALTRTDLSTEGLPRGLADTLLSRIATHDWHARMLVALAALHRGSIPVHLWLRASGLDEATFFTALDRLSDNGIMVSSGAGYGFAQESMRELVRERIEPGLLARLHLGLAQALGTAEDADDDLTQLTIGWHLVHGGREREGAARLGEVAPRLLRELTAMDAAIPALERALEILERTGAPPRLTLAARGALGRAAYTFDHELDGRHGMRTLELMHEELGLSLGDRLRPVLGALISVRIGLVFSVLRNLFRPAHRKGPDVISSLIHYASTLMAMMGVRLTALDPAAVAELTPYMESLRGFVGRHGARATYLAVRALGLQVLGRESTLKKLVEEAIRFSDRPLIGMHPSDRRELLTGLYTSLGLNESCRGTDAGLQYVPALLQLGSFLGEAAALRVRLIHHMQRGQWSEAEALRRALELQAIQGGATWQTQWFAAPLEASMLLRSCDLVGARRAIEQLRTLARVRPSLGALLPGLELQLRYHRGDHQGAHTLIPELLAASPPCSCVGWGTLWAVAAAVECHLGDYACALERCDTALAAAEPEDLEYVTMYGLLDATRAWALAGLGRLDEARARIEALCARRIALRDRVGVFELYTARCHIARLAGDDATLRDSLDRMVQIGSELRSPGMLASAERVAKELGIAVSRSSRPPRGEHPTAPSRPTPEASVDEAVTAVRTPGPVKLD